MVLMPIRPEMRALYPPEWPLISDYIRFDRAMGRCECDGRCGGRYCRARLGITTRCPNYHGDPNVWTGSKVVLTTAHLDHQPPNCDPSNLLALCQACHLSLDRDLHAATRAANRRKRDNQMTIEDAAENRANELRALLHRTNPVTQAEEYNRIYAELIELADGPVSLTLPKVPQFENDGEAVAWLGVDAMKWTAMFLHAADLANAGPDFVGTVHAWFCNAIGAGQSSMHKVPEKWFSDAVKVETIVEPGGWLRLNLREDDKLASVVFDHSFGKATHAALTKWLYPEQMCHNGHPFRPGTTSDNDPPSAAWCDECGEARKVQP